MHSRKRVNKKSNTAWIIASAAVSLSMITLSLTYIVSLNANVKAIKANDENNAKVRYMSVGQAAGKEALVNPSGVKTKEVQQQANVQE